MNRRGLNDYGPTNLCDDTIVTYIRANSIFFLQGRNTLPGCEPRMNEKNRLFKLKKIIKNN